MYYVLSEDEYESLSKKAKAIDEIREVIEAEPEADSHGNSKSYAYRFDKTISAIKKALDDADVTPKWQMPWFRETKKELAGLHV